MGYLYATNKIVSMIPKRVDKKCFGGYNNGINDTIIIGAFPKCVRKKGGISVGRIIRPPDEVEGFLEKVRELLTDDEKVSINSGPWANGRVNKTRQYMAETGIHKGTMVDVIRDLQVSNYSCTKPERNPNFPNEYVWEFGVTKNLVDKDEDLYVKLKIRKIDEEYLLVMSFHPEQPSRQEEKLTFPYSVKSEKK